MCRISLDLALFVGPVISLHLHIMTVLDIIRNMTTAMAIASRDRQPNRRRKMYPLAQV